MTDRALRSCILNFLKLLKLRNNHVRRVCNNQWCAKLERLSGENLLKRLKFLIWWAPFRVIMTGYNRGILSGSRVLVCVYTELKRRGVENTPWAREIAEESRGKRY